MWFCACKSPTLAHELLVSIGPSPHVWFLDAKQRLLDSNYKALWVKDHTCCFYMQDFDFWITITILYWSQTWPVILCMYNSVLNIRITSLYGSQPLSLVFACKTALFFSRTASLCGPWPHLSFCAFKTAWLESELLVSMGPSPFLWFLHAKQRLLDQTYKSVCVPDLICSFEDP